MVLLLLLVALSDGRLYFHSYFSLIADRFIGGFIVLVGFVSFGNQGN